VDGRPVLIPVVPNRLSFRAPLSQQLWWIALLSALYRLIPIQAWRQLLHRNPWINAMAHADVVGDIRGGDSFSDIYGLKRFLLGALTVATAFWVKGDLVLFPQTYGPYKSFIARRIARAILLRARVILSRDQEGLSVVNLLTQGQRQAIFCPDVAFALEAIPPPSPSIEPPLSSNPSRLLIGLNPNGLMFHGGYNRGNMFGLRLDYPAFLKGILLDLLARPEIEVLLVPHTYAAHGRVESDNETCARLAADLDPLLAHRVHVVTGEYDQHAIKGIIGSTHFFIGSRMHACIAALSQGIPTVGVAYSRKFAGVFASVGAESWIVDGRTEDAQEARRRILHLLDQRQSLQLGLQDRVSQARTTLDHQISHLLPPST
jgi:colanic acid/amylovoran biosynthesis protein